MIYISSPWTDPAFNLALEQYVFDRLPKDNEYFMLWQNDNTIVIGKNQNTWAEINNRYVDEHGIKVVRRLSGGGAVYHDLGNVNFTFITDAGDASSLDLGKYCEAMAAAIRRLGADARAVGRNDITIDGKKVSGNSQYIKDGRVMHHGTLLFASDLSKLGDALVTKDKYKSAAKVDSVYSRVTNIRNYLPKDITLDEFKDELVKSVFGGREAEAYEFSENDLDEIKEIKKERYDTWEWNYGSSPDFEVIRERRVPKCGKVSVGMDIQKGRISDIAFSGDFFGLKDHRALAERLKGCLLIRPMLEERIENIDVGEYFAGLTNKDLIDIMIL